MRRGEVLLYLGVASLAMAYYCYVSAFSLAACVLISCLGGLVSYWIILEYLPLFVKRKMVGHDLCKVIFKTLKIKSFIWKMFIRNNFYTYLWCARSLFLLFFCKLWAKLQYTFFTLLLLSSTFLRLCCYQRSLKVIFFVFVFFIVNSSVAATIE